MDFGKLKDIDLNLLTILRAVIELNSVSRAAETLGISQATVSKAVAKLRSILDDDIFIRGAGGIQLTARTLLIRDTLCEITDKAVDLLRDWEANPMGAPVQLSIACDELVSSYVIPRVLKTLGMRLCGRTFSIQIKGFTPASYEDNVDFFFILHESAFQEQNLPKKMKMTHLGKTNLKVVIRDGHPLLCDKPGNILTDYPRVDLVLQYASFNNIIIRYGGNTFGIHHGDASLTTPYLFTAIQFLRDWDAILLCPLVSSKALLGTGLQAFDAEKFGIKAEEISCSIVHWRRDENDPLHREFLAALTTSLGLH